MTLSVRVSPPFSFVINTSQLLYRLTFTISLPPTSQKSPDQMPLMQRVAFLHHFPQNITHVPEIRAFSNITDSKKESLKNAEALLGNGTALTGFDVVSLGFLLLIFEC